MECVAESFNISIRLFLGTCFPQPESSVEFSSNLEKKGERNRKKRARLGRWVIRVGSRHLLVVFQHLAMLCVYFSRKARCCWASHCWLYSIDNGPLTVVDMRNSSWCYTFTVTFFPSIVSYRPLWMVFRHYSVSGSLDWGQSRQESSSPRTCQVDGREQVLWHQTIEKHTTPGVKWSYGTNKKCRVLAKLKGMYQVGTSFSPFPYFSFRPFSVYWSDQPGKEMAELASGAKVKINTHEVTKAYSDLTLLSATLTHFALTQLLFIVLLFFFIRFIFFLDKLEPELHTNR